MGLCPKPFNYGDRLKIIADAGLPTEKSLLITEDPANGIIFSRRTDGQGEMIWLGYDRRDDPATKKKPRERNADGRNALEGPYYPNPPQLFDLSIGNVTGEQRVLIETIFITQSQNDKRAILLLDQRISMNEKVKSRASVGTFTTPPVTDMGLVHYWPIFRVWFSLAEKPFYNEFQGTFSILLTGEEEDRSEGIADRGTF